MEDLIGRNSLARIEDDINNAKCKLDVNTFGKSLRYNKKVPYFNQAILEEYVVEVSALYETGPFGSPWIRYMGVWMKNSLNGYVQIGQLNNEGFFSMNDPKYPLKIGNPALSIIEGDIEFGYVLHIFNTPLDFLAYLEHYKIIIPQGDIIILNNLYQDMDQKTACVELIYEYIYEKK